MTSENLSINLSLGSHTNVGKTTLARTLLKMDIGEIGDRPHVTALSEPHVPVSYTHLDVYKRQTAARRSKLAERLIGDGLVPLHSALGQHHDAWRTLIFAQASQRIFFRMNHLALLSSPEVTRQMVNWLTPVESAATPGS